MLILAQRWVTGTPSQDFGRQVVEALVIAQDTADETANCTIYSAFYDPAEGQMVQTAFHWWRRHASGLMPALVPLALDVISHWQMPPGEVTGLHQLVERLEQVEAGIRQQLGGNS